MSLSPKKAGPNALWRGEFECAYDESRLQAATEIYDRFAGASEPPELVIKAARAHLPGDPGVSLRLLLSLHIPASRPRDQVERDALLGEAYARTNDFESADERLDSALRTASLIGDGDLIAYIGFRMGIRHMLEENAERAREAYAERTREEYAERARAALELVSRGRSRVSRIFALYTSTALLQYEERLFDQAERLIELLRLLDPSEREGIELTAIRVWATTVLAVLARDLYIPNAIAEIERQLNGPAWPKDFAQSLFHTLKGLAWAKALQGDYFNAFRHLKRASEVAYPTAWKVVAACDRSFLARYFGERGWSRVELDEAEQLAAEVDWHGTLDEERAALLLLAELFCDVDTARASMYLGKYRSLGELKSPRIYRHDARVQAFKRYPTGIVELALGNQARGLADLREARAVFERVGYDFRAAKCLVSEYRATGDRDLLPALEEKLRHYQQSWLANELRGSLGLPKPLLSPKQQTVFAELCQGKSTAEIARSLGRSEYTVSNHIKEIFKAFGVKSRAALLAKAAREGLVSGP